MIQDFFVVPIAPAVRVGVATSVVNTMFPADAATEIQNDIEWLQAMD